MSSFLQARSCRLIRLLCISLLEALLFSFFNPFLSLFYLIFLVVFVRVSRGLSMTALDTEIVGRFMTTPFLTTGYEYYAVFNNSWVNICI